MMQLIDNARELLKGLHMFIIFQLFLLLTSCMYGSDNTQSLDWDDAFKQVLHDIEKYSIRNLDWHFSEWQQYRNGQLRQLPIKDKKQFYACVERALAALGDNHSLLFSTLESIQNQEPATFERHAIAVDDGIGIIKIPTVNLYDVTDQDAFLNEPWVTAFHEDLKVIRTKVTKGWIINLTHNWGGTMYPMLAALTDFYDENKVGGFWYPCKDLPSEKITFDGQHFFFNDTICASYSRNFSTVKNKLPVVVLINDNTASSAEFLALALQRQPNVTIMGQPSQGVATCNRSLSFPEDLGNYLLTMGYYLDSQDKPFFAAKINPAIVLPDDEQRMIAKAKKFLRKD